MEQAYCTAVFWRGGEKIDLNGLKPDAVRCLSVTGERKVNLSFLRDYPNLEELTLMEKCEGVEVLSGLKQLHTLSLWLSAPVSWDNVSLPGLRVLHLRGEKNGDITPLLTSITYLHLEEMRKTEDLAPFLTLAPRLQKLYLQSLPAVQKLPARRWQMLCWQFPVWKQPRSSWRIAPSGAMAVSKKPLPPLGSPHCCGRKSVL